MKTASFVLALPGLLLVLACDLISPDQSVILGVTSLEVPAAISSGESLTAVLTVSIGGCQTFDHIEVDRNQSSASLTAWGRDAAKGRKNVSCPTFISDEPHAYTMQPPFNNPFTVLAQRGSLNPLTSTVEVR